MPKIKTTRIAAKKFRMNANGKAKHARAGSGHRTGGKRPEHRRRLRGRVMADATGSRQIRMLLPYLSK